MFKTKDITGLKFGRWTVLENLDNKYCLCKCDCGTVRKVTKITLKNGTSKSCGCLKLETSYKNLDTSTHKLSKTRIYKIWKGMKDRCYNSKTPIYKNYGARNIKVCDEWKNDFMNFYNWSMDNGYNENLSIDRINVNDDYKPSNCRWADRITQQRNTRKNVFITYNGETHCMKEWAEIVKMPYKLLQQRLKRDKLTFEQAITKEIRRWN